MKVLDPGHEYLLDSLDGERENRLVFVKRDEPAGKYPGNVGHHPGTTTQEVLRALIDRLEYVNAQAPCPETRASIMKLGDAVWLLESRAARLHGRPSLPLTVEAVALAVSGAGKCEKCGHVGCEGGCHQ